MSAHERDTEPRAVKPQLRVVDGSRKRIDERQGGRRPQPRFPYLVVRLIAGVYQREEIDIRVGEPEVRIGYRQSYVCHPEPYSETGAISPGCRELLVQAVLTAVQKRRLRMCLVWARDACTFCERDGVTVDSKEPPSGGVGGTPLPVEIQFDRDQEGTA